MNRILENIKGILNFGVFDKGNVVVLKQNKEKVLSV